MGAKGGLWGALGAVLSSAAPPAVLALADWKWVTEHLAAGIPILAIIWLAGGFAVLVWQNLRSKWARGFAAWIDSTLARWRAGYGRSYRLRLRNLHRSSDEGVLSYRGAKPADIEDVFIDVSLAHCPPGRIGNRVIAAANTDADADSKFERRPIWDFMGDQKSGSVKLAIIGAPGSGKTTLLRHVALSLARKLRPFHGRRRSIPVLLFLRECVGVIVLGSTISLPELIESQVKALTGKPPAGWFERRLDSGRCVVMFDGLDEIARQSDRQAVLDWIHVQTARYPDNDYVVTSRPHGYWDYSLKDGTVLQVREFTPDQIEEFVRARCGSEKTQQDAAQELLDRIDGTTALAELAVNPLLLTMIVQVFQHGKLPATRPELYAEFCDVLLGKWQDGKNLHDSLELGQKLTVLRKLAFAMMESRLEKLSAAAAAQKLSAPLSRISAEIRPADFLDRLHSTGLFTANEQGDYGFAHGTFCEYLAATDISRPGQLQVLLKNVADPWWRETIIFYAAISGADKVVEACLKRDNQLSALALAFECADADRNLSIGLRSRLKILLAEATDPDVPVERRRLAAAVIATRELRPTMRLAGGALACGAPVSRELFEIFVYQSRAEFPSRGGQASDPETGGKAAAAWVQGPEALAFLKWLNDLPRGQRERLFRLPTRAEAEDPRLVANLAKRKRCVWLASPDSQQDLDLWVPPGLPHPYAVTAGQLRERAEADSTGPFSDELATVLAFALTHTLAVADTLLYVRRPRDEDLAAQIRKKLEEMSQLAYRCIDRFAPGTDNGVNRVLKQTLNSVKASALSQERARHLASDFATSVTVSPDRALDLAIELTRVRASDLATSIRVLIGQAIGGSRQESLIVLARPASRSRELAAVGGRILASLLDSAFDNALGLARQSEIDLELPMCLLFARQIPVEGQQRKTLDPIWGSALEAVRKQRQGRIILPGYLATIAAEAREELSAVTTDAGDMPAAGRLVAVAAKVHDQVGAITDPGYETTQGNITYARLGAISLAANLAHRPNRQNLAAKYLDIAVGVTSIERQVLGQGLPQETMILVQA